MSEPIACPFCGEVPAGFDSTEGSGKWGWVQCCIAGPDVRTGYKPLQYWREDAIAAWNTRASVGAHPKREGSKP